MELLKCNKNEGVFWVIDVKFIIGEKMFLKNYNIEIELEYPEETLYELAQIH